MVGGSGGVWGGGGRNIGDIAIGAKRRKSKGKSREKKRKEEEKKK
jgi:hypothetical protein